MFLIFIILFNTILLAYLWIKHKYNYWSRFGINGPKPSFRQFGTTAQIQGGDPMKVELELVKSFGSVYGTYIGLQPALTISDPELIKAVLVKDFPLFVNRRALNSEHPVLNNALFFSDDEVWKKLRHIASPTFTSGRLKGFVSLMNRSISKLEHYFEQLTTETNTSGGVMNDTRTIIMGFTIETIASTMFSATTGSNESSNDRVSTNTNLFIKHALQISEVSKFVVLCNNTFPKWFNSLIGIEHQFNVESTEFYISVIKAIISGHQKLQQENKATNFVQLLVKVAQESQYVKQESYEGLTASMDHEFKKNSTSEITSNKKSSLNENEITGLATGIFLAGFDTLSSITSSALYELALNTNIQERLFRELSESLDSLDPDSEEYLEVVMNKLPYLDCVIKETLRKYPVLARLERRLGVEKYNLGKQSIPLTKNQLVEISVIALHYNPEIYPEPFRFDPERFAPENKHLLVPHSFIPFGDGPRNCLGMRFAYQEMKLCLSRILCRYRFLPTDNTPRQLTFLPFKFVLISEPYPLQVIKREN